MKKRANIYLSASTDTKCLSPTYPTAHSLLQSFFRAFRQAKSSINFSQLRTAEHQVQTQNCAINNIIVLFVLMW